MAKLSNKSTTGEWTKKWKKLARKERIKKANKLQWIGSDDDLPFNYTWKAKDFVIEWIEGRGGEDGGGGYLLKYGKREIEYFSKLSNAKKVAQLIHNG